MPIREFPPVDFYARPGILAGLAAGVTEFAADKVAGACWRMWLRDAGGQVWAIGADSCDLEFKFEVFTLWIDTLEGYRAGVAARFPDMASPEPPAEFRKWPLGAWRMEVLRRAEFLDPEAETGPSLGEAPVVQSACRPGDVPAAATASCEVAVGLLFTGRQGGRLLVGVDWFPLQLAVLQADADVDAYLEPCERLSLETYASRQGGGA